MTNEQLEKILKDLNLSECEPIIEEYIFYIKKMIKSRTYSEEGKFSYNTDEHEFLVIANKGKKQAIILRYETTNLHWFVLKKWRNQGVLSNALRTGILQQVWPENKTVTCCYSWCDKMVDRPLKYEKTKHLAKLEGLQLKN